MLPTTSMFKRIQDIVGRYEIQEHTFVADGMEDDGGNR